MYVAYGSYTHDANEVNLVSFNQRTKRSGRGLVESTVKTVTLEVVLIPSTATQANIKSAIEELEDAYGVDGRDWALYHDDGTRSLHSLTSRDSISGVRVMSLDYPKGDGAEYATQRTASIVLEAEYPGPSNLLQFQETIRFMGNGGARYRWAETLNGPPQRQLINLRTVARATQSGTAVGHLGEPEFPSPIWPDLELLDLRERNRHGPQFDGNAFKYWGISWNHQFESGSPLFGEPNRR